MDEDPVIAGAKRRVGTTLRGKYTLDAVLGVGGMAAVYRATHRNAKTVAVKMLHAALAANRDVSVRFLREGYTANRVGHPGVVQVLDDDTADDGAVFLVMELLQGETLEQRWERAERHLAPSEVTRVMLRVLDVLAAAHDKEIVHRDIKPENLFLTEDGGIRVLDFGIARVRDGLSSATRTGRMMGTPAFMPPEQALGRTSEIDGRTDLWAVGATMFTLLTGRFVHDGAGTMEELLVFAATKPAPSILSVMPSIDRTIATAIDRALAFDRTARWSDARAMASALDRGRAMSPVRAAHAVRPSPVEAAPAVRRSTGTAVMSHTPRAVGAAAPQNVQPVAVPKARPSRAPLLGGVALVAAIALFAGAWVVVGHKTPAPAALVATAPSSAPEASFSTAVPAPAPGASETTTTAPAGSSPSPSPMAPGTAAAKVPIRTIATPTSLVGRPAPSASARPASSVASAPAVRCDPPFTIDDRGHKIPKRECL